VLIALGNFGCL